MTGNVDSSSYVSANIKRANLAMGRLDSFNLSCSLPTCLREGVEVQLQEHTSARKPPQIVLDHCQYRIRVGARAYIWVFSRRDPLLELFIFKIP